MERILTRRDIGSTVRGITAIIYHPTRKEILVGYEGNVVVSACASSTYYSNVSDVCLQLKGTLLKQSVCDCIERQS